MAVSGATRQSPPHSALRAVVTRHLVAAFLSGFVILSVVVVVIATLIVVFTRGHLSYRPAPLDKRRRS
jgi:hypothetical protein